MCAETVREWQKMYRVIGRGGLLAMGVKRIRYDYETKVGAAGPYWWHCGQPAQGATCRVSSNSCWVCAALLWAADTDDL